VPAAVCLCDVHRDGILDMLVTDVNGYFLYRGLPGGRFVDVTRALGLPRVPFAGVTSRNLAAFVDLDGDGWEDLILGDHVYRNEEGKRFIDYSYRSNPRLRRAADALAMATYDR